MPSTDSSTVPDTRQAANPGEYITQFAASRYNLDIASPAPSPRTKWTTLRGETEAGQDRTKGIP